MKILNPEVNLDDFFGHLADARERALLLDYDGTLASFQDNPDEAYPYPGVLEKINGIMHHAGNRVAIISGRWTKDLKPRLNLRREPEIWGSHGIERLYANGRYELEDMDEDALRGLAEADEWVEENHYSEYCEAKPGCLAMHWRALDETVIRKIHPEVKPQWIKIAQRHGLQLREFDGGIELRVPGRDKGDAVRTILSELDEHETVAAYLGDDLTDEDAFRAVRGRGIGVLVREELRETEADVWIRPPHELLQFLSNWEKTTGGYDGNSQ